MLHGLSNDFLYSAVKIEATFCDDIGKEITKEGTGFYILNRNREVCLVTNRHMIDIRYLDSKSKYARFSLNSLQVSGKKREESSGLPEVDQAAIIVNIQDFQISPIDQNDIACLVRPYIRAVTDGYKIDYLIPHYFIADKERINSKLAICDFVAFPGYHPEYDKLSFRPILRTGTISSDPRFDHSYNGQYCGECIAYEAFSYNGASGSPIYAVQKGPRPGATISFPDFREIMLIGVNAGHKNNDYGAHSGISYMYKSSVILDIVDQ